MPNHDDSSRTPPVVVSEEPLTDPVAVIGKTVGGRYRVLRLIAEGGTSAVYEAHDDRQTERRALKFIPAGRGAPGAFERFEREARIGANHRIPSVPRVFELDHYDDSDSGRWVYIAMQMLDGESLGQRLRRCGPLSWQEAVRIISMATVPLEAAHDEGIVHRDLKPDNLLITPAGELYVLDFGVASFVHEGRLTVTGVVLGTVDFMAPEQATSQPIDLRADVYGLGATLFYLIACRNAYRTHSFLETLMAIATGAQVDIREYAPSVPVAVAAVIRRAMAPDREQRYATMAEFRAALEAARC